MESLFCSAAQAFSYANEPNGDATKVIDDVFGLAVHFLYELHFWQQNNMRFETTCSGSWHNGTSF